MSDRVIAEIVAGVALDALAVFGIPATTLSGAFRLYLEHQISAARDILIEEVRKGGISTLEAADRDEAIAVCYRYLIAARDGAARRNLRLLAKVIVGLAKVDRLYSDEFNRYSDICSRLNRDQIFVIGRLLAHRAVSTEKQTDPLSIGNQAYRSFLAEVVPAYFETSDHLGPIYQQLHAMGLSTSGVSQGNALTRFYPPMAEILELADFQDLLAQEGEARGTM